MVLEGVTNPSRHVAQNECRHPKTTGRLKYERHMGHFTSSASSLSTFSNEGATGGVATAIVRIEHKKRDTLLFFEFIEEVIHRDVNISISSFQKIFNFLDVDFISQN
jgi:hypothetical protein